MTGAQARGPRLVSLVPSVTETLAALGAGACVVGVTDGCVDGVPDGAVRLGRTTDPAIDRIVALAPDIVVADENGTADLDALRAAGIAVHQTGAQCVADVDGLLGGLAEVIGEPGAAGPLLADLAAAREAAAAALPAPRVVAVALVGRDPWRGVGPDTYVDDLLWQCGFANALAGFDKRYPPLDPALVLGADVVLLPTGPSQGGAAAGTPGAFGPADASAVAELVGVDVVQRYVDGRLLTWPGAGTAAALWTFSGLAAELAGGLD